MNIKTTALLILLFSTFYTHAQNITVSGLVKDMKDQAPLPYVNVVLKTERTVPLLPELLPVRMDALSWQVYRREITFLNFLLLDTK